MTDLEVLLDPAGVLAARVGQVGWVLGYLDDLTADFLRFYRIDLHDDMEAARFFALAHRVFAYGGVMAERQRQEADGPPAPVREPQADTPPPWQPEEDTEERKVVDLATFRGLFPDLIS